jgi:ligand-binding sensor domain-containing protein
MWVSTEGKGLYLFDPLTGQFRRHYRHDPPDTASLNDDRLTGLYRDRAGVMWIASKKGLSLYDPVQRQFTYYRYEPENDQGLTAGMVWGMAGEDGRAGSEGNLWLGASATINRFDLATGGVTLYPLDPTIPPPKAGFPGAMYDDPDGFVWAGLGWGPGYTVSTRLAVNSKAMICKLPPCQAHRLWRLWPFIETGQLC